MIPISGFKGTLLLAALSMMAGGIRADTPQEKQEKKEPIPAPEAQEEALKTIRDVFKAEYAKRSSADKLKFAQKLLEQALQSLDDLTTHYVLLVEARDRFMEGGDVEGALLTIEKMGLRFSIQASALKSSTLKSMAKNAKTPEELGAFARANLKLIDEAIVEDDYDTAGRSTEQAATLARGAKDVALTSRAQARGKDVADLKAKYDRYKKAKETLASNPQEPASNTLVGRYECFTKGNWEVGLPLLAAGSEESTHSLAAADLAHPTEPPDQMALGDGWWALGESETPALRDRLRERASGWYEKCAPKLTGLAKTKVDQRLSLLRTDRVQKGDWVDVTDPKLFGYQSGKLGDPIDLTAKATESLTLVMTGFPKGDFDGVTIRVHPARGAFAIVIFEGETLAAWVDGRTQLFKVSHRIGPSQWTDDAQTTCEKADACLVTILIVNGAYVIYADGQEAHRLTTPRTQITSLTLIVNAGRTSFDQIKLRRRH